MVHPRGPSRDREGTDSLALGLPCDVADGPLVTSRMFSQIPKPVSQHLVAHLVTSSPPRGPTLCQALSEGALESLSLSFLGSTVQAGLEVAREGIVR